MSEYIQTHQSGFWIAAGFAMLAAEVLLFGFTTIILLFAGLGAVITGLLMTQGVLPETWIAGTSSFGICTGIISMLLWKPLKSLQNNTTHTGSKSSDLIGFEFVVDQDISATQTGTHRYSGVDWKVELDHAAGVENIPAGQRVTVSSLDAGIFRVKPV